MGSRDGRGSSNTSGRGRGSRTNVAERRNRDGTKDLSFNDNDALLGSAVGQIVGGKVGGSTGAAVGGYAGYYSGGYARSVTTAIGEGVARPGFNGDISGAMMN